MSKENKNLVLDELSQKLRGKTILLGMGNVLRKDDGFGSFLASALKNRISFKIYDAGSSPENFLGAILKEMPDTILFVDAVDFEGEIGELRLFNAKDIKTQNFFLTHNTSLSLLFDFLCQDTKANFYLLAVQPKKIDFGEGLSAQIDNCLKELKSWFLERYGYEDRKNN